MTELARPCDRHVVCPAIDGLHFPDPDSPFANLSSEGPDPPPSQYCVEHPSSPLCTIPPPPPPPNGCRNCGTDNNIIPIPDGPIQQRRNTPDGNTIINTGSAPFHNTAQSCTVFCPDGSSFDYTLDAGRFISIHSQAEADANAASYCEDEANSQMICILTDTLPSACVGDDYGFQVIAEGGVPKPTGNAYFWSASGLPPGMSINPTRGILFGFPTTPGNYSVTITVEDGFPNTKSKTFTLTIGGISNSATLPTAYETDGYSVQLNGPSGAIYSTDSVLPHWLTLSSTGLITGSPDIGDAGNYTFTITQTSGDLICSKTFTLQVWQMIHTEDVNTGVGAFNSGIPWTNSLTAPLTPPFSGNWISAHYEFHYKHNGGAHGIEEHTLG